MLYCDGEHLAWDFVSRVRALIWPFGSSTNCMCFICCYVVEVLFVSCCICSCECLSYRV